MESVLTVKCKLQPTLSQVESLEQTVSAFARACNYALKVARETGEFRRFKLHRLVYRDLRAHYGLSANLAVQAIARVGQRQGRRTGGFKAGSVTYDARTLSLQGETVSLSTVDGRLKIPLAIGNYQRHLLQHALSVQGGQLVKSRKGKWSVHLWLHVETPLPPGGGKMVGIDLGQAAMATLSTGERFSGGSLKTTRLHYRATRAEIRSQFDTTRTRGSQRLWERLSGKERRFVRHTLHTVTRRIVANLVAGDTIAIENLTHLRSHTTRRGKRGKYLHQLWPYHLLRHYLEYKAAWRGIRVVAVDPHDTSKTCPRCGCREKANRKTQRLFQCVACGFQHNADAVASWNIAQRAGSMGMGHQASTSGFVTCPRILGISTLHRPLPESPRL
ncbi:MAG: IS200/IS605 family element transposase accessory protein TnpB [Deinococcus sp.]|nr:IS200/IS605 family element transposase accessory protein TnpB [Deinococcus sp.]